MSVLALNDWPAWALALFFSRWSLSSFSSYYENKKMCTTLNCFSYTIFFCLLIQVIMSSVSTQYHKKKWFIAIFSFWEGTKGRKRTKGSVWPYFQTQWMVIEHELIILRGRECFWRRLNKLRKKRRNQIVKIYPKLRSDIQTPSRSKNEFEK